VDHGVSSSCSGWCPPGHYCPPATVAPLPCPDGTYATGGALSCIACPNSDAARIASPHPKCTNSKRCCSI
jgi:hypothetical protein